jgi:hypothetical protein
MSREIKSVYALVDWHNVQGYGDPIFRQYSRRYLPNLLFKVQREISLVLQRTTSTKSKYRVVLRIYHGWHQGRNATPIRQDFESLSGDETLARRFSNVSFARGFQFGNELACSSDGLPLYSTYRGGGQGGGQKMIDSAIICDLLHLLRFKVADVCIVVSDDDDYIPALLTAKAWALDAILLRRPESGIQHVTDADCRREIVYWSEQ